jgi:hypothetical protein
MMYSFLSEVNLQLKSNVSLLLQRKAFWYPIYEIMYFFFVPPRKESTR